MNLPQFLRYSGTIFMGVLHAKSIIALDRNCWILLVTDNDLESPDRDIVVLSRPFPSTFWKVCYNDQEWAGYDIHITSKYIRKSDNSFSTGIELSLGIYPSDIKEPVVDDEDHIIYHITSQWVPK